MGGSVAAGFCLLPIVFGGPREVAFETSGDKLEISIGGRPFATYVHRDPKILRPYFANLRAPGGLQVTRRHPPVPGQDATDHAEMHPGVWLAFGRLGGQDFWRNRARIEHERFLAAPQGGEGHGTFTVRNRYRGGGKVICQETCRVEIRVLPEGYLLSLDSHFRSAEADFTFGDQQEMGFGVRLARPLTVQGGGQMVDSEGRRNEKGIWGLEAAWCAAGGNIAGRKAGVVLLTHPENFRPSRFHARDYGVLVANPFGRKDFGRATESRVVVRRGGTLRLRFGLFLHTGPPPALPALYQRYLRFATGE